MSKKGEMKIRKLHIPTFLFCLNYDKQLILMSQVQENQKRREVALDSPFAKTIPVVSKKKQLRLLADILEHFILSLDTKLKTMGVDVRNCERPSMAKR